MTNELVASLTSALSELDKHFHADAEIFHEAVAIVFSSIFRTFDVQCIIVGGQSAAYWMRMAGSTDVDFVSSQRDEISNTLVSCGFTKAEGLTIRYTHPETDIMIEIVGDKLKVEGVTQVTTVEIEPDDIDLQVVKLLMSGPAEILNPVYVFLNYVEASHQPSIWFDYGDQGSYAVERAHALLNLYGNVILEELRSLRLQGEIDKNLIKVLGEKFNISL